jgi:hypothetical protein
MPALLVERFGPPVATRDRRTLAYCGARAADALAGRTVWCSPRLAEPLERLLRDRAAVRVYSGAPVGTDDVVMLDDAPLAPAVRECGAHAVVGLRTIPGSRDAAVDAYVVAWSARGTLAYRLAAVMPQAGRVAEKDMGAAGDELAWGSLLADVVDGDRDEHVGGRRHVRPAVAAR